MIVVDTNVIVYFYIPGDFTPLAERLLAKDGNWVAPNIWRSELRNVLSLYVRKRLLDFDSACAIQSQAELLLANNEYWIESLPVLQLAEQSGLSAYDCEFVALAQSLGVPLVTSDKKVLRAFPNVAFPLFWQRRNDDRCTCFRHSGTVLACGRRKESHRLVSQLCRELHGRLHVLLLMPFTAARKMCILPIGFKSNTQFTPVSSSN